MKKKTNLWAGSHIPMLVRAIQMTDKPVLELGTGYNSTPLLHWICEDRKLPLMSLESDKKWIERFYEFRTQNHIVGYFDNWDEAPIDDIDWGVVLIDHRPALRRRIEAKRLANKADIIILHDSEPEIQRFYGYQKIYPLFRYKYTYDKFKPNTTLLSNTLNVERIFQ